MGRLLDAFDQAHNGLLPLSDIVPKVLPPPALKTPARSQPTEDQSELYFQPPSRQIRCGGYALGPQTTPDPGLSQC
jgi:hypothetical protein